MIAGNDGTRSVSIQSHLDLLLQLSCRSSLDLEQRARAKLFRLMLDILFKIAAYFARGGNLLTSCVDGAKQSEPKYGRSEQFQKATDHCSHPTLRPPSQGEKHLHRCQTLVFYLDARC